MKSELHNMEQNFGKETRLHYLHGDKLLPGAPVPVLQVSFISRHRSLTEDALLPSAAPIVAQSLPCFIRSLKQESANQHLVQLFSPF